MKQIEWRLDVQPVARVLTGRKERVLQLYLNTADISAIRHYNGLGLISGITTNPTILAGQPREASDVIAEICSEFDGPVSVQPVADTCEGLVGGGRRLRAISDRIVVKLPATLSGFEAAAHLEREEIPCNLTLCFTIGQALLAANMAITYVSVFSGRLAVYGQDGENLLDAVVRLIDRIGSPTRVIAASITEPSHVTSAVNAGAQIATIGPEMMETLLDCPLTREGLKKFECDWIAAKKSV